MVQWGLQGSQKGVQETETHIWEETSEDKAGIQRIKTKVQPEQGSFVLGITEYTKIQTETILVNAVTKKDGR